MNVYEPLECNSGEQVRVKRIKGHAVAEMVHC